MSDFILKNGWRNDNALWMRIAPESKASIRELLGAINTINLSKNSIPLYADRIADSLKANLAHFFDQRYHLPVPLMTKTNFWEVVNDFERVANDLIIYGYCYEGKMGKEFSFPLSILLLTALTKGPLSPVRKFSTATNLSTVLRCSKNTMNEVLIPRACLKLRSHLLGPKTKYMWIKNYYGLLSERLKLP